MKGAKIPDDFFKDKIDYCGLEDNIYNQLSRTMARAVDIDFAKTPIIDILTGYTRYIEAEKKVEQLENIRKEAIEYCKNKKEKIANTTDYRQYYIQGYETAIKNTNSTHDGVALEWVKNTIKNDCDDLLNILSKGSDKE